VGVTLRATKRMVGYLAASNQSALLSSPSSVALVVEIADTGSDTSSCVAARLAGLSVIVPVAPGITPKKSLKPKWLTVNSARV
jgi:hypothetical protein